jgi:pimeloyl-ACP methyl ester carboxylesterase
VWGPDDAGPENTVLAVHGITATHLAFAPLARRWPGRRLLTPDLRGRGRSNGLGGPFGMARHADDLVHVLDAMGVERVGVLGHSMGAFVAMVLAHRHPDRVEHLVLVDGGLPIPVPPGLDPDQVLQAVIGPAAERLAMRFTSLDEHRQLWRQHPAFAGRWTADVEAYVDYDLVGAPPELRPSASYDAVRSDSIDLNTGADFPDALAKLSRPALFLRAERGMLDQPGGLYPRAVAEAAVAGLPLMSMRTVPDVNHYTIVMSDAGADAVATAVEDA